MQSAVQELLSCVAEANAESARPGKCSSFMTDRKRMPGQREKRTGDREQETEDDGQWDNWTVLENIQYTILVFLFLCLFIWQIMRPKSQ